jgi:hypothetical protein
MDGNQSLAAESDFHSDPPQGGGSGVTVGRRIFDHGSEPLEQQSENGLALALGPAQPLRFVMEDGAGSAAFEAAL